MWKGDRVGQQVQSSEDAQSNQQQYDMAVKAMLKEDAQHIIPLFVPGATLVDVLDIEIIQSNLRADRAFGVRYEKKRHLIQLEIQSGADKHMISRLLAYHASLWYDYGRPIISIVIYLF